jgi:hypothetical protein
MESARSYREGYPQRVSEKLFMPFNKDGEVNDTLPEAAALVEGRLSKYPVFVGLTYIGSSALGYSEQGSDIDLALMHDESIARKDQLRKYQTELGRMNGTSFDGAEFHFFEVPIVPSEIVEQMLSNKEAVRIKGAWALAVLLGPARGPKVREYRENIREGLKGAPQNVQEQIADAVAHERTIAFDDRIRRTRKRMQMSQQPAPRGYDELALGRQYLWRKRVITLLDFKIQT